MNSDDPAPEEQLVEGERDLQGPAPLALPRWVPAAIAIVLVALAALAVYTGLQYRGRLVERPFVKKAESERLRQDSGAPGEPEPGASRVLPGEGNDVPQPSGGAFTQQTRVAVVGGKEGLSATYRVSARRGLIVTAYPDDAMIYVNDHPIGPAKQFGTEEEMYEFPAAGNFTVRLEAPGFRDLVVFVAADPYAEAEIAKLDVKMVR